MGSETNEKLAKNKVSTKGEQFTREYRVLDGGEAPESGALCR